MIDLNIFKQEQIIRATTFSAHFCHTFSKTITRTLGYKHV